MSETNTSILPGSFEQDGNIITVALFLNGAATPTFVRFDLKELFDTDGKRPWVDVVAEEVAADTGRVEVITL